MFLEISLVNDAKVIKNTLGEKGGSLIIESKDFPAYLKTFNTKPKEGQYWGFLSYKTVVLGKHGGIKVR